MNQRIIHQTFRDGAAVGVAVIVPHLGSGLTIQQVAAKDVPTGLPYKIVDASEIPTDRSQRNSWSVDVADLTDGVGA